MIRAWAGGLCALAIAAAMVRILAPDGSMRKMLRLVVGALALCVLVEPLLQLAPHFRSIWQQEPNTSAAVSGFSELVRQQTGTAAQEQMRNAVALQLQKADIPVENIEVHTDILPDGRIQIDRVTVTIRRKEQQASAVKVLRQTLGITAEVKIHGA